MGLSHVDKNGVKMVDVGEKENTNRVAKAHALVKMKKETIQALVDEKTPKGDVLNTARIAGISAAKKTSELIPMCHTIPLNYVKVDFGVKEDEIEIITEASAFWKTGVEMEALTAASVAALTIYDMLKAVDKRMSVEEVYLISKDGGKSGHFER